MNFRLFRGMTDSQKSIFFSLPFVFSLILIPAYLVQILNIYGVLSINTDLVKQNNSEYSIRDVEEFDDKYAVLKPTEMIEVEADEDGFLVSVQAYPMDNMVKMSRGTKSVTVTYPSFVSTEVVDDESDTTKLEVSFDDYAVEANAFDTICNIYKTDYGYKFTFPEEDGFNISVKELPEIRETNEGTYEVSNRVKYFAMKDTAVLIFNLDKHQAGAYMVGADGVLLKSVDDYKSVGFDEMNLLFVTFSMAFLVLALYYVMRQIDFNFKLFWLNYLGVVGMGAVGLISVILL